MQAAEKPRTPRTLRHLAPGEGLRLDRTVMELRERELSYPAIAAVLDLYEGHEVDPEHVRAWAGRLGLATNPNKKPPVRRAVG